MGGHATSRTTSSPIYFNGRCITVRIKKTIQFASYRVDSVVWKTKVLLPKNRVTSKSQKRHLGRTQTKGKQREREEAWRSDSCISSLDILTVVCDVSFTPRPRTLTSLWRFVRDIIPWTNLRENNRRECSWKCFRDVVNLILWQLLITACMRDLWVRQGLIHCMLLRSIASFLRCNDTSVHSGSGKRNVRKL